MKPDGRGATVPAVGERPYTDRQLLADFLPRAAEAARTAGERLAAS